MSLTIFHTPRLISFDGLQFILYKAIAELSEPCLSCSQYILRDEEYSLFSCCGRCCHERCLRTYLLSHNSICSNCLAPLGLPTNNESSAYVDERSVIPPEAADDDHNSIVSGPGGTQASEPQESTTVGLSSPPTSLYFVIEPGNEEDWGEVDEGWTENDEDCSICRERFQNEVAVQLPCDQRHRFHKQCIGTWLARSSTCPLCRINVLEQLLADFTPDFGDEMAGPDGQGECRSCGRHLYSEPVSMLPCTNHHAFHKTCVQEFIATYEACPICHEVVPSTFVAGNPPILLRPIESVILTGLQHVDIAQWVMFLHVEPAELEMVPNLRELLLLYREASEPLKLLSVCEPMGRLANAAVRRLQGLNRCIQAWKALRWEEVGLFDVDWIMEELQSDEPRGSLLLNFFRNQIHLLAPDFKGFRTELVDELLG